MLGSNWLNMFSKTCLLIVEFSRNPNSGRILGKKDSFGNRKISYWGRYLFLCLFYFFYIHLYLFLRDR